MRDETAAGPRLHPCAIPALWAVLALASAVALGLQAPLLGAGLGVFALIWVLAFGQAIADGQPRLDTTGTQRITAILAALGVTEPVRVLVYDRQPLALRVIRGHTPRLIAAAGFVRVADDELLRAAVALGVAELRCEPLARRSARARVAGIPFGLAIGFAIALLTPDEINSLLLMLAASAAAAWVTVAGLTAWTRRPETARAYAPADAAAAALAGGPGAVRGALNAFAGWREEARADRGPFARLVVRCVQPLAPDWHEAARAAQLTPR
jgi:hypothetical protein